MKVGDMVRCLDTGRIGVIIDVTRGEFRMYMLVAWPTDNCWVDATDIELALPN
jgi:hypothetical protein